MSEDAKGWLIAALVILGLVCIGLLLRGHPDVLGPGNGNPDQCAYNGPGPAGGGC